MHDHWWDSYDLETNLCSLLFCFLDLRNSTPFLEKPMSSLKIKLKWTGLTLRLQFWDRSSTTAPLWLSGSRRLVSPGSSGWTSPVPGLGVCVWTSWCEMASCMEHGCSGIKKEADYSDPFVARSTVQATITPIVIITFAFWARYNSDAQRTVNNNGYSFRFLRQLVPQKLENKNGQS